MSGTVTCHSCGKEVAEGAQFCSGCGTEVVQAVDPVTGQQGGDAGTYSTQCVSCGSPMSSDAQFCPKCGASRPEAATLVSHVSLRNTQAGQLIEATKGEFEIIRQLGIGAMGAVYLAEDLALSRKVAIKIIAPSLLSDDTMISRFRLEAQTVASLRHPNIVAVHAVRESDDLHFFVMEFIDGPSLSEVVKNHAPLDVSVVQGLVFQVGSALSYAHRTSGGVIHRDIKPANIMVERGGDAFVTDFGISKIAEAQTGLTQTGATIGTPEYMSPEQCRGEPLTGASDQYALGIVAYVMLCGHTPFSGSHYHIMVAHTSETPQPIREIRPECPDQVATAVERMLAKTPEERWPDLDSAVAAMGGTPLGHHDPTRAKIVALTGATLAGLATVDPNAPTAITGGPVTKDTATSVSVTGLPSVIEAGDSFKLAADVRGSGDVSLGGQGVQWASTDPAIASVENGVVKALHPGTVSITAAFGNVAHSLLLTVAEPAPAEVLVSPASVQIQKGGRIDLSAKVQDRRGDEMDRVIKWLTSDAAVATVTQDGEVIATGGGSVTVTADSDGVTGTAEIVVEVPAVEEAPAPRNAPPVKTTPAQAKGGRAIPRPKPVPQPWYRHRGAVLGAAVAVIGISGYGAWAALGGGGATADNPLVQPVSSPATGGELDTQADLATTSQPPPDQGAANPADGALEPAGGADSGGSETAIGPVSTDGSETAAEPEATPGGDQPDTDTPTTPPDEVIADDPPPPVRVAPTPANLRIGLPTSAMEVGGTQGASAQVFDGGGGRMASASYALSWRSTDLTVISVDRQTGAVRADGPGTAWVVAAAGNARDSLLVTVADVIASVKIDDSDISMEIGVSRFLSASVVGQDQQAIDRPITWSSSDRSVATVDAGTGRVTSVAEGVAQITASVEGFSDNVAVSVEAPAPTVPSAQQLLPEVESYLTLLGQGDRDAVTRFWGPGDEDRREELFDVMGRQDFVPTLGPIGQPVLEGDAATVSFEVSAAYRSNFGQNREETLNFRAQFAWVDSQWQLTSCVVQ